MPNLSTSDYLKKFDQELQNAVTLLVDHYGEPTGEVAELLNHLQTYAAMLLDVNNAKLISSKRKKAIAAKAYIDGLYQNEHNIPNPTDPATALLASVYCDHLYRYQEVDIPKMLHPIIKLVMGKTPAETGLDLRARADVLITLVKEFIPEYSGKGVDKDILPPQGHGLRL